MKKICNEAEGTNETSKSRHEITVIRMLREMLGANEATLKRSKEWQWDSKCNSVAIGKESSVIISWDVCCNQIFPLGRCPEGNGGSLNRNSYDHLSPQVISVKEGPCTKSINRNPYDHLSPQVISVKERLSACVSRWQRWRCHGIIDKCLI